MSRTNERAWGEGFGAATIAVAVALFATAVAQPRVFGQFHDDGLYLSTAQSLADGQGYRHASLPTTPAQTKYPPLYSAALAAVSRIAPASLSEPTRWYKAIGAVCLGMIVMLAWRWGRQRLDGRAPPLLFAALVGVSPLVFPWADYTMTELPFFMLCLAAFTLAPRHGQKQPTGLGRAVALGVVCGLALLVRQAGLPLILAALVAYGVRREWRQLSTFAIPLVLLVVPWFWFKATHASTTTNPLLAYYTGYEPSALQLAFDDPQLAIQIVLANLYYLWSAFDLGSYLAYFPAARILVYPVLLIGLWRVFKVPLDFLSVFSVLYAGLILLWPWNPARYSIPLAPLVPLSLLLGTQFLSQTMAASEGADAPAGARFLRRALPWLPTLLVVVMAAGWLLAYRPHGEGTTRMAFLSRLEYDWSGFEETADWIRNNTPPDAILATAYDPMYFLSTGRRGVRPWLHKPWTYSYPRRDPRPDIGSAAEVQDALESLGASYLVIDPLDGYLERDAAKVLFEALLEGYSASHPEQEPQLRFVSRDSLHRVYGLPIRR